jgi:RimJ/RimL family protein N-acetyltransferase
VDGSNDLEWRVQLRTHDVRLREADLRLRPLCELDWPLLYRWNADEEVLRFAEGREVHAYTPEQIRGIYTEVSQSAFCFVIEVGGVPIGEGWLQRMNLERWADASHDFRRIDLMIGEKAWWGRGYGTRAISLLTHFAFESEHADAVFACDVADFNARSLAAFRRAGFQECFTREERTGIEKRVRHDLRLDRARP